MDFDFGNIWNYFSKACLIFFIIIIFNSILGDALFRIKYSFPKISTTSQEVINTNNAPIQINLENQK